MGRAVVLGGGQQLREEGDDYHVPRQLRVWARTATRAECDDEKGGKLALHGP
jgi:hypothetical protein